MQYREYRRKEVKEEGRGRGREQGRSEEKGRTHSAHCPKYLDKAGC